MTFKRERTAAMVAAALGALLIAGASGPAYLRFLFQLALGDDRARWKIAGFSHKWASKSDEFGRSS